MCPALFCAGVFYGGMLEPMKVSIVALDPGRNIGVAFVAEDGTLGFHDVLELAQLEKLEFPSTATVLVGDGTGNDTVKNLLTAKSYKV